MDELITQTKTPLLRTSENEPALSKASFKILAYSAEARTAALESLAYGTRRREADEASGQSKTALSEIAQCLIRYRQFIETLASIHSYYHGRLDVLNEESGRVAAYVIYAKVIRLLNMTCTCLEHRFWDSLILLRPIDEAVQLAEYFASFGKEEPGATRLRAWFHENKSPMNAVIREALAEQMDQILGDQAGKASKSLLGELHNKKSKELHHTYNGMWEVHCTKIDNGKLVHTGFDYGACSFPRALLDITRFFESSIWTAVQGFVFCFREQLPLEDEHVQTLMGLDRMFSQSS